MNRSVKYLALITIFVVSDICGKFINGPWLINRIEHLVPARTASKALSPVIFGSLSYNLKTNRVTVPKFIFLCKIFSQSPAMAEVKSTHDLTNRAPFIISAIKQQKTGSIYGWTWSYWRH